MPKSLPSWLSMLREKRPSDRFCAVGTTTLTCARGRRCCSASARKPASFSICSSRHNDRAVSSRSVLHFGYSTLWLAEAAASVGAMVTTYELAPEKHVYAADMIGKAGLGNCVRFVTGDALSSLSARDTPVDFALIDLWKDLYIPTLDLLYPRLSSGAIVCADNMLFPDYQRETAATYTAHVCKLSGAESL